MSERRPIGPTAVAVSAWLFAACQNDPPAARVIESVDLGPLETSDTIRGRDGGYSGHVFGRSVWLYGDTILSVPDEDGETWHNSSMSFTEDFDARDGLSGFAERNDTVGAPRLFLERTLDEERFNTEHATTDQGKWVLWPGAVVSDPDRNRALVFYLKVLAYPGAFNFEVVGTSIAVWTSLDDVPERRILSAGSRYPTLLFSGDEPQIAAGGVVVSGLLHAYACTGTSKDCVLARAPLSQALERSAWRFWNGAGWTEDWRDACGVMNAHDIVTVHRSPFLERFVAFYSEPLSNDVNYRTAPAPEGPWSDEALAFRALAPTDGIASYSAVGHAELAHDDAEYVTYHRGLAPFESEIRLVRVHFGPSGTE